MNNVMNNSIANFQSGFRVYTAFLARMAQQNNPLAATIAWGMHMLQLITTHRSNSRLAKYRKSLYEHQLERMTSFLEPDTPYKYVGKNFNKRY